MVAPVLEIMDTSVVHWKSAYISEEHVAFIFRIKEKPIKKQNEAGSKQAELSFMLVLCLVYSSALMLQMTCSSKTSDDFQYATWHYIPEDRNFCENLKSRFHG
jgi:hypothetical protein